MKPKDLSKFLTRSMGVLAKADKRLVKAGYRLFGVSGSATPAGKRTYATWHMDDTDESVSVEVGPDWWEWTLHANINRDDVSDGRNRYLVGWDQFATALKGE